MHTISVLPIPTATHRAAPLSSVRFLSNSIAKGFPLPSAGMGPRSLVVRMGGGPRTYPGGVSKWQWKRMQAKKAKQLLQARLLRERQLYETRKRAELKEAIGHLERPWEPVESPRRSALFSVSADEQVKVLADRFRRPGGFDMWNDRDGPVVFRSPTNGLPSQRFFPKDAVHSVRPYVVEGERTPSVREESPGQHSKKQFSGRRNSRIYKSADMRGSRHPSLLQPNSYREEDDSHYEVKGKASRKTSNLDAVVTPEHAEIAGELDEEDNDHRTTSNRSNGTVRGARGLQRIYANYSYETDGDEDATRTTRTEFRREGRRSPVTYGSYNYETFADEDGAPGETNNVLGQIRGARHTTGDGAYQHLDDAASPSTYASYNYETNADEDAAQGETNNVPGMTGRDLRKGLTHGRGARHTTSRSTYRRHSAALPRADADADDAQEGRELQRGLIRRRGARHVTSHHISRHHNAVSPGTHSSYNGAEGETNNASGTRRLSTHRRGARRTTTGRHTYG